MTELTKGARVVRGLKLFVLLFLVVVVIIFVLTNLEPVNVVIFSPRVEGVPLGVVILVSMLIGAGIALGAAAVRRMVRRK